MFDPVSLVAFSGGLCFWQWAFNKYDEYKEKERREEWQRKYDEWKEGWYKTYLEKLESDPDEAFKMAKERYFRH